MGVFFKYEMPEDFMAELLETEPDAICEEVAERQSKILEDCMKRSVKATIQHDGDSELVNSIRASKPRKSKNGAWIGNVNPHGMSESTYYASYRGKRTTRKYKVSNVLKAIWKEYGIAGRQPPRPFLTKAMNDAEESGVNIWQEVYDKRTGGI